MSDNSIKICHDVSQLLVGVLEKVTGKKYQAEIKRPFPEWKIMSVKLDKPLTPREASQIYDILVPIFIPSGVSVNAALAPSIQVNITGHDSDLAAAINTYKEKAIRLETNEGLVASDEEALKKN